MILNSVYTASLGSIKWNVFWLVFILNLPGSYVAHGHASSFFRPFAYNPNVIHGRCLWTESKTPDFGIKLKQEGVQRNPVQYLTQRYAEYAYSSDTITAKNGIRHETVKRGMHPNELGVAEYVIAGGFTSEANARRFSEGLRSLEYNARVGYLTEKALWYVYLYKGTSAAQARARQSQYSKIFLLRDVWLLTVE